MPKGTRTSSMARPKDSPPESPAEGEGPDSRPWRSNSTVVQRAWAESCTQEVVAVTAATPRPSPLR